MRNRFFSRFLIYGMQFLLFLIFTEQIYIQFHRQNSNNLLKPNIWGWNRILWYWISLSGNRYEY